MHRFCLTFIYSILFLGAFSQGEIDSVARSSVRNEYTIGVSAYSNGWGLGLSYGKMLSVSKKRLLSTDFSTVKDFKELKISNPYTRTNNRFVYGKKNSCVLWRVNYGHLFRLYAKKDKRGIEIRWYYKIGATLAFIKPIYYKFIRNNGIVIAKFTENPAHISLTEIQGKAPFYKGFSELKLTPGLHGKVALSFEFGKKDFLIQALETGVSLDAFPKKIELMMNDYNQYYNLSLFLSFRIGTIKNPRLKNVKTENF